MTELSADLENVATRIDALTNSLKGSRLQQIAGVFLGVAGILPVGRPMALLVSAAGGILVTDAVQNGGSVMQVINALLQTFMGITLLHKTKVTHATFDKMYKIAQNLKTNILNPQTTKSRQWFRKMYLAALDTPKKYSKLSQGSTEWVNSPLYADPFDSHVNSISVVQSKLGSTKDDWTMYGGFGVKGQLYDALNTRRLAPSHSDLVLKQGWIMEDGGRLCAYSISGVGSAIGDYGKVSASTNMVFNAQSTSVGSHAMFFKDNLGSDGPRYTIHRLPLDSDIADLRAEASYYYKIYYGDSFNPQAHAAFLDSELWKGSHTVYDSAYSLLKTKFTSVAGPKVSQFSKASEVSPAAMRAMYGAYGEYINSNSFKYDLLNSNCHDVATAMAATLLGESPYKYAPRSFYREGLAKFSQAVTQDAALMNAFTMREYKDVHDMMKEFFHSTKNAVPTRWGDDVSEAGSETRLTRFRRPLYAPRKNCLVDLK
jgi:hypothetical protein